jgi:coenzyme F420-dependent glucose-6-phosphate dehydrogenase
LTRFLYGAAHEQFPPDDLLRQAMEAEDAGFDGVACSDHFQPWWEPGESGMAWVWLGAVGQATRRVSLGTAVTPALSRYHPALVAQAWATLEVMFPGRTFLGIGSGESLNESPLGLEWPPPGVQLEAMTEALELISRLFDGERVTHDGHFYRFRDAVCAPRPIQQHLPVLIGGSGPTKTLPLIARSADLWNGYGTPESLAASDAILRERCADVGRDPDEIERTVNLNVVVRDSVDAAERAWKPYVAEHRPRKNEGQLLVGGPVEHVAAALVRYAEVGFRHPILIFRRPWDLETIAAIGRIKEALAAAAG